MRQIKIQPPDGRWIQPEKHNAGRQTDKVPILVINATALNTGHNWRFEASTMGEAPRGEPVSLDVDKATRLKRPKSYDQVTAKQRDIWVGHAVAASSGVPGIFPPLALSELYDQDVRVQLVDGGVHDNQGIRALRDYKGDLFIVSDASGQMQDLPAPWTNAVSTVLRAGEISMDRVREEGVFGVLTRPYYANSTTAFLHLRKGLAVDEVSLLGVDGKAAKPPEELRAPTWEPELPGAYWRSGITRCETFGVAAAVQDRLSRIRTDLDSFSDVEAQSLMLDGYLMSEFSLRGASEISRLIVRGAVPPAPAWGFLRIKPWMSQPTEDYLRQLHVGRMRIGRVFAMSPWPAVMAVLPVVAWIIYRWPQVWSFLLALWTRSFSFSVSLTFKQGLVSVLLVLAGWWLPRLSFYVRVFLQGASRVLLSALPPTLGFLFIWAHIAFYNPVLLLFGRVERLASQGRPARAADLKSSCGERSRIRRQA